jgi:hypothetical protein
MTQSKMKNSKSGHIQTLYAIAIVSIIASLAQPFVIKASAKHYAEKRYGDRVAPLTVEEKAEWYHDMGIAPGALPDIGEYQHFRNNCKNNVFF